MNNKVIVLGNGFIANHLNYFIYKEKISIDIKEFEKLVLDAYNPDVIINCIGYCGINNIDDCENNKEKTILTNTILPILLAQSCLKRNIKFINISSGCLFYGESQNSYYLRFGDPHYLEDYSKKIDSGWKEDDITFPQSVYVSSKLSCDLTLKELPNTVLLRIRMPISSKNHSRNFINKIKQYNKLIDIPNSMTFMDDLVKVIDFFVNNHHSGIFNVVNEGTLTATRIMQEYQKYVPDHQFEIISEEQLDQLTTAKRSNCILNSDKLHNLLFKSNAGFELQNCEMALKKLMPTYIANLK